ncbi:tyrosine-type recombinase/integrase [Nocardioides sp. MAHUQ-72]|uniref:tyrosine-type recombinase/integrase n=1 Tax=unclassified Nocardioides TaxID=2615069 RepID=UPI00360DF7B9
MRGNIAKRPSNKWRARYRDASGREHARHFDRKIDAERWLSEITAARVTGNYVDPGAGRASFAGFYADWSQNQIWASTTRRAMDLAASSVTFGDMPLGRIRRSHVEQWIKSMEMGSSPFKRPLAAGTIHTRVNNVRAVLCAAVADRLIATDPSDGVRLPRRRRASATMAIPSPAQVGALLEHAPSPFRPFVALCAFAGLRLGEAAALQVGDVDFLARKITVNRQVQRGEGGAVQLSLPKYSSERHVFAPPSLLDLLAEHVQALGASGTDWLFTGSQPSTPPHQNTIGHRWRETVKAAGLSGFTLHHLRHFYASGLIAAGCDVVTVQRALGHASASTTLQTYAHLWPTAEDKTRAAAEELFAASTNVLTAEPVIGA